MVSLCSLVSVISTVAASTLSTQVTKEPASGCTTTSIHTVTPFTTFPFWPQCVFDGTERIYPSTKTMTHGIDCNGCKELYVQYTPIVGCPNMAIKTYVTETTPRTVTRTSCRPSSKTG